MRNTDTITINGRTYINPETTADMLEVAPTMIFAFAREHELPGLKFDRLFYDLESVEQLRDKLRIERRRIAELMSPSQLAEHLGIGEGTVYLWRKKGCPSRKEGKRRLFDLAEVEQWIEDSFAI